MTSNLRTFSKLQKRTVVKFEYEVFIFLTHPLGTGHSANGIVAQKTDFKTVVVSLADYQTIPSWNGTLDVDAQRVRMASGRTFLDLYSLIRPEGFMLPAKTAGWFFSLAGVFLNPSVHGGTKNESPIMEFITAARVMFSDGSIREVTD